MADPFGRAIEDHLRGERTAPLLQHARDSTQDHPIEQFYFDGFDPASDGDAFLLEGVDGPLLDVGAGAGQHALALQDRHAVTGLEVSDALVETMRERGVADARRGDLFALREAVDRRDFASVLVVGTQIGLATTVSELEAVFEAFGAVTRPDATVVLDAYDPDAADAADLFGYREVHGVPVREFSFEYEGEVGETLRVRLYRPAAIAAAAEATGWSVVDSVRPAATDRYVRYALESA
ncbi:MAG: methyltransferase domain-containing protein [Halanaeroarchaeum sp.]